MRVDYSGTFARWESQDLSFKVATPDAKVRNALEIARQPEHKLARAQFSASLEKLLALSGLPSNWDGYGAPRIEAVTIGLVATLLNSLKPLKSSPTAIVPSGVGTILVEWRLPETSIGIEVFPSGTYQATVETGGEEHEWEGDIQHGADPELVRQVASVAGKRLSPSLL